MTPQLPFGAYLFKALKLDITLVYILPEAQRLAAIHLVHTALAEGALVPAIHDIVALDRCAAAHDAVMTPGRAGAVLLKIG